MRLLLLLLLTIVFSCSNNSDDIAGGPGGQTTNGFTATLQMPDNSSIPQNTVVNLRPTTYKVGTPLQTDPEEPITGATITAELDGTFLISHITPNSYIVEVLAGDTLGIIDTITIIDDSSTINHHNLLLAPVGTIKGEIFSTDSINLYIKGIDRNIVVESNGIFTLSSLAPWNYTLVVESYSDSGLVVQEKEFSITSGNQTDLGVITPLAIDPLHYKALRTYLDSSNLSSLTVEEVLEKRSGEFVKLNLTNRGVTRVPTNIEKLTFLKEIRLDSNQIEEIPKEIEALTTLQILSISNNRLTTLPIELGNCTALTTLDLSSNILDTIPQHIGNLQKLKVLNLSSNQLIKVPETIIYLSFLTTLDCHNNLITTLPAEMVDSYVMILNIDFRENKILAENVDSKLLSWLNSMHGGEGWLDTQEKKLP